eukprot:821617-Pleurochrysis_carterae.AAC.3
MNKEGKVKQHLQIADKREHGNASHSSGPQDLAQHVSRSAITHGKGTLPAQLHNSRTQNSPNASQITRE